MAPLVPENFVWTHILGSLGVKKNGGDADADAGTDADTATATETDTNTTHSFNCYLSLITIAQSCSLPQGSNGSKEPQGSKEDPSDRDKLAEHFQLPGGKYDCKRVFPTLTVRAHEQRSRGHQPLRPVPPHVSAQRRAAAVAPPAAAATPPLTQPAECTGTQRPTPHCMSDQRGDSAEWKWYPTVRNPRHDDPSHSVMTIDALLKRFGLAMLRRFAHLCGIPKTHLPPFGPGGRGRHAESQCKAGMPTQHAPAAAAAKSAADPLWNLVAAAAARDLLEFPNHREPGDQEKDTRFGKRSAGLAPQRALPFFNGFGGFSPVLLSAGGVHGTAAGRAPKHLPPVCTFPPVG
eukprot:gene23282-biopygen1245